MAVFHEKSEARPLPLPVPAAPVPGEARAWDAQALFPMLDGKAVERKLSSSGSKPISMEDDPSPGNTGHASGIDEAHPPAFHALRSSSLARGVERVPGMASKIAAPDMEETFKARPPGTAVCLRTAAAARFWPGRRSKSSWNRLPMRSASSTEGAGENASCGWTLPWGWPKLGPATSRNHGTSHGRRHCDESAGRPHGTPSPWKGAASERCPGPPCRRQSFLEHVAVAPDDPVGIDLAASQTTEAWNRHRPAAKGFLRAAHAGLRYRQPQAGRRGAPRDRRQTGQRLRRY